MQLALLRPVCACAVLLALARATGRSRRLLQELRAAPSLLVALGLLGYATSGTLTSMALALLPAGVTSPITNTSRLVLVLGGLILFRQRIGAVQIIGTLAGFGGMALLSLHSSGGLVAVECGKQCVDISVRWVGVLVALLSSILARFAPQPG